MKNFSDIWDQFQHIGCPGETILGSLGALGSTWSPKYRFRMISVKKSYLHFELLLAPLEVTFFILVVQGYKVRDLFEVIVVRSLF